MINRIQIYLVKLARPNSSQNLMDTAKTTDSTCLCMQINNTVGCSYHTHIKDMAALNDRYIVDTA